MEREHIARTRRAKILYDQAGGLVRISGSDGDQVDEFCFDEHGRKLRTASIIPCEVMRCL